MEPASPHQNNIRDNVTMTAFFTSEHHHTLKGTTMKTRTSTKLVALTAAALIALTGCATTPEPATETKSASEVTTIENGWVKAADSGMSAAFGELVNNGTQDVTVVSATTEASKMVELHETVASDAGEMVMREKDDGFVIPSGKRLMLKPGGNHIMLMGIMKPIKAGEEVTFTLTFSDKSTLTFSVPAKDFSGGNESYEGGGMDMGGDK